MGRPRKYATQAEATRAQATAKAASDRQRYLRKKHADGIPRYVAYMPVPSDVPSITPPDLLLRSDSIGLSTAPTMPSDYVQDSLASSTKLPQPMPLPLPLALQPPAFHLRQEEDEVYKQQQEQLEKDRAASREAQAQENETSVLAQIDDVDSIASSQKVYYSRRSSGGGSYSAKKKQQVLPNQSTASRQVEADDYDSDDFLNPSIPSQIPLASDMQQDQSRVPLPLLSHHISRRSGQKEESTDEESNTEESQGEGEESEGVPPPLVLPSRHIPRSVQEEVSIDIESTDKESINEESTDTESDNRESDGGGDIIQHLAQQLQEFKGCSDAEHEEQAEQHALHYC